tara:strand:- start:29993 stop:30685 length:693 start_codon:yes stop_codon:yes gene_type:complete
MPSENAATYTYTGAGADILEFPSLNFILTTDPVLGTNIPGVPDGPYNQQLWKLLQNDFNLAAFLNNYFVRTYGVSESVAQDAEDPVVLPLPGAPVSPADKVMHMLFTQDAEITYRFNGTSGLWEELGRRDKPYTTVVHYRRKLVLPVVEGDNNLVFEIPTEDDNEVAVAYTIDDLKIIYVNNLDVLSPVIGVIPGLSDEGGGAIRVLLTAAPVEDSDYEVIVLFEKLAIA